MPFTSDTAKQYGVIGGTKRGYQRRIAARVNWEQRYPGIDPLVATAIYRAGYQAAWRVRKSFKAQTIARDSGQ